MVTFVTTNSLNLRDQPGLSGRIVHVLNKGEVVIVRSPKGVKGDWLLIETVDLMYKGFVHKNYLIVAERKTAGRSYFNYFKNIIFKLAKETFSVSGLFSTLITGIMSVIIFYAKGRTKKWMDLISMGISVSIYEISRRWIYGLENLMLLGLEGQIFFAYHCLVGALIWRMAYPLIYCFSRSRYN